jgi:hypothetical protein
MMEPRADDHPARTSATDHRRAPVTAPSATPQPVDLAALAAPLAWGRVAIGASMVLTPTTAIRPWIGDVGREPGARVIVRALGVRDLALGAGLAAALARGDRESTRTWLVAGVASDAVDAVATLAGWRHLPRAGRLLTLAVASGAALVGAALAAD